MTTVIIDYGCGNLRSLAAACRHVGMGVTISGGSRDPDCCNLRIECDAMILPGVGSFSAAMKAMRRTALNTAVWQHVETGRPLLGICLGMQVLFDHGDEGGEDIAGLGLIPGTVRRLPDTDAAVPNVGWRSIAPAKSWDGTLLEAIEPGSRFYFSHSYACAPEQPREWLATTQWGRYVDSYCRDEICAAVQRGNVTGLQFHPEKSGEAGLAVLRAWRGIVEAGRMAA